MKINLAALDLKSISQQAVDAALPKLLMTAGLVCGRARYRAKIQFTNILI